MDTELMREYKAKSCLPVHMCPYCRDIWENKDAQACCGEMHITDGHIDVITGASLLYADEYKEGCLAYVDRKERGLIVDRIEHEINAQAWLLARDVGGQAQDLEVWVRLPHGHDIEISNQLSGNDLASLGERFIELNKDYDGDERATWDLGKMNISAIRALGDKKRG